MYDKNVLNLCDLNINRRKEGKEVGCGSKILIIGGC